MAVMFPGAARPVQFECDLREQLKGRRLVGELDLEGELFETAKVIAERCGTAEELARLAYRSPATLAVYLVGSGAQFYEESGYWQGIRVAAESPVKQRQVGEAFERALRTLDLEDFAWVLDLTKAFRYVTPILLHGTIPRRDVASLVRALCDEIDEGAATVTDALAVWRQGSRRFDSLHQPIVRFVRYGGAVATDLLGRIWDAVIAKRAGLEWGKGVPRYISAEIDAMDVAQLTIRRAGTTVPQPAVMFDPWSGGGPQLLLPATTAVERWLVTSGEVQERFASSAIRETQIELPPDRRWRVEGEANGRFVVRRFFEGAANAPVFLFDSGSGLLRRDQSRTEGSAVLAVVPQASVLRDGASKESLRALDELPPMFGAWSGFRAVELDLRKLQSIEVVIGDVVVTVVVAADDSRPRLVGSPIAGVRDGQGRDVYDGLPQLRLPRGADPTVWTVRIEGPDGVVERSCADLAPGIGDSAGMRLDPLMPSPLAEALALRVRGPLGSDLADDFTVVEGLRFDRPTQPAGPLEAVKCAVAVQNPLVIPEADDGELLFRAGVEFRDCLLATGPRPIALRFSIPRLLWSVWCEANPVNEDGSEAIHLEPEAFADPTLQLGVSTGVACDVALVLVDDKGTQVQAVDRGRTSEAHGRRRFDLRRAADSVRGIDAESLTFRLIVGDLTADAVKVWRKLHISDLIAELVLKGDECHLDLAWEESGPSHRRTARLWAEDRPWEAPIEVPLTDRGTTATRLMVSNRIPAGPYLLQISGQDDAARPAGAAGDCVRVVIPQRADADPASFGTDAVGQALSGTLPVHRVALSDIDEVQERELAILFSAVARRPGVELDELRSRSVQLLFHDSRDSAVAAGLIVDETHRRRLGAEGRVRLGIELVRTAVDCPSTDLSDRQRTDVWQTNRVLAAALDRPDPDDPAACDRWMDRVGWKPSKGLPIVGKPYGDSIGQKPASELRALAASARARSTRLLRIGGFDLANIGWLIETWGARTLVTDWLHEHRKGWLLPRNGQLPQRAVDAVESLRPSGNDPALRFPRDVTAAAMQFVLFGGNEAAARLALIDAAYLAPMLVERQLVVAVIHHLIELGSITLPPTSKATDKR